MKLARVSLHATFGILLLVGLSGSAVAAAKNTTGSSSTQTQSSATGIQTYTAATQLQIGTIVQLGGSSAPNSVEAADQAKLQDMYGVVIDPNALPLTVTNSNITNETYVADSGTYNVLVDTQNGSIKEGDYVTLSAVDGVAMEAGTYEQQNMVLGRAAAGFNGKTNAISSLTLKSSDGKTQTAQLGLIPVAINIQRNPNERSTKVNLPPFLQQVGQAIAQKPIGPQKLYLSLFITVLCICVALVTLYAGIRNAVISIGRNPLSKKVILRGLMEVILASFLILIIGLFAVYLLLKL